MSWAIVNKKNGKFVKGTDYRYNPPRQRLTLDAPKLFDDLIFAELDFINRRCNKNYKIVKVKIVKEEEKMIDLTFEDLKNMYGPKKNNVYEQCWVTMKGIVSNNRCSSLGSNSDYADGRRTAYDEMCNFMKELEKTFGVEDE